MASVSRVRFFRTCLAFFFVGAALFVGGYGVLLFVEAFDGHGSPGGNVLLIGLGLFLLCLSPIGFIAGIINWRLAHSSPEGADS
jgi:hypothetical protein